MVLCDSCRFVKTQKWLGVQEVLKYLNSAVGSRRDVCDEWQLDRNVSVVARRWKSWVLGSGEFWDGGWM